MKAVLASINQIKNSDINVLILGETGSGKEMVARAIHQNGPRKNDPLVSINCAGIPQSLIESELFGHEKGAFSGAYDKKIGKFELANGGTIFLDEIGDLSLEAQAKILRLIENREFMRIGGNESIKVDIRLICATNKDLLRSVKEKSFRQDLYYRIAGFPIEVPPLRQRKDDIPELAVEFLREHTRDNLTPARKISKEALAVLLAYSWPGNARELQNTIARAATLAKDKVITVDHLGPGLIAAAAKIKNALPELERKTFLQNSEKNLIIKVLAKTSGNISRAAGILGIHRSTLYRKLTKFH